MSALIADSVHPPLPLTAAVAAAQARKLKVCIASFDFIGPVRNGGVGTAFTSLGEALAEAGHAVTFLYLSGQHCESAQPLAHWINEYRNRGISFVPMPEQCGPKLDTTWTMGKAYQAYQWLLTQDFDIVHFSEWRAPGYYALLAKHQGLAFAHTQFCVHTHGPTLWSLFSNGEYLSQLAELELDFMERESVRLADVVASPSHYLLRWMQEQDWKLPAKVYVQQYVRPSAARPVHAGGSFAPRRIKEIVFFGRLEVRKGLVLFCQALDRLKADPEMRGVKITFLGKLTQVQNEKGADFIATRAKAWPWPTQVISDRDQYGAIDYLVKEGRMAVIPSMVDNLPNTVLECLGAQIPFLASTTGGIPEMLAPEDAAEMLFPLQAAPFALKMKQAVLHGLRPARFAVEPAANRQAWIDWHWGPEAAGTGPAAVAAMASSNERPLVSICISHFNRPKFLQQALASIAAQDYTNLEVVLVDDASTQPDAVAYVESLGPEFAKRGWQLIRNREELFVGAARNIAARHARGDYLKFMDDDNVAKPHEVSTMMSVAQRTRADIVSCALDFFGETTAPKANQVPTARFLFLGAALAASALRNYLGDTNCLFRRKVFEAMGGFHEERRVGNEDWKLIADALLHGYHLEAIPDALVWYRRTGTGENASVLNSQQAGYLQNIQPYLKAVPPDLRNLVLYAQGASLRQTQHLIDTVSFERQVTWTCKWKAKLEAGLAMVALNQEQAAARLMIEAIKAVETCPIPKVQVEAILEVGPHLAKLDPGRARFLLGLAAQAAAKAGKTAERDLANKLLADIPKGEKAGPCVAK
jgi:O-antigen biosynthesis protein